MGIPCPGCGLTHALWSVLHLHFQQAFHFYPIWPAVILFFVLRRHSWVGRLFVIALFSQWVVRIWLLHSP
ncbi:MAG: DUF2752 domain-containing protein [Deltaproteobacteria bacterium]|nr:DUF2752 domain-containing protein [Deltaproteobacteria bacterium]